MQALREGVNALRGGEYVGGTVRLGVLSTVESLLIPELVELGEQGIRAYTLNPGVVTTDALRATIGDKGVIALRAGSAPPQVPAAVMLWLATDEGAVDHQRKTIHCQPFAREHGIVEDWR